MSKHKFEPSPLLHKKNRKGLVKKYSKTIKSNDYIKRIEIY
ncbi:hypothetical protein JSCD14_18630 [Clostridioides difficile]|uniref:Uncharacterized protein n=1 Tax=Clostridioides difficile NAP08 TaxID=525259 RepID=D5Q6P4_CLODI|nr:hypothetical protein HMPREF0220_2576 [Clostridioides difficile NAP08]EFH15962.1 hypothetical protein HMPREF0219_1366 [Clostridioides difficile NAP07]GMK66998.1 hypothetical protein JSCD2_33570 [Clostridioides difficile]GMK72019.1 hypothetical protein JSCD4_11860 [Clostridioides difficile]GMK76581.1 hypothetical protein JSCD5_21400 [Clostridioides difficile]